MAITSTDNQTAEAPIVEAPVASKTASPPTTESEPAPTATSKPVSHNIVLLLVIYSKRTLKRLTT